MKFSILISNYNKADYIEDCILSCLNQTYKNFEVIVFDNCSNDGSLELIEKYKDRIFYRTKKRVSSSSSANQIDLIIEANKIATGDIICLLDSDDYILQEKLENLFNLFSKNNNVAAIFETPRIKKNNKFYKFKSRKKDPGFIPIRGYWPTIHLTSDISVRKEFLENCISKKYFDDYPLLTVDFRITIISQLIDKKFLILNENESYTVYNDIPNSIMSNIRKFSRTWWTKRYSAHLYVEEVFYLNRIGYRKNFDFYIVRSVLFFLNIFK